MSPPQTTIIFDFPDGWLIGIDTQFFNTNNLLKGIKSVPAGIHLLHYSHNENSVRSGKWLDCTEGKIIIAEWQPQAENVLFDNEIGELNVSKYHSKLPDMYPYMISYPEDRDWVELTRYIDFSVLEKVLPSSGLVSSIQSSKEENAILLAALKQSARDRAGRSTTTTDCASDAILNSIEDQSENEIKFTAIDHRVVKAGVSGSELTAQALDRSWYLAELIENSFHNNQLELLGEFQLTFILILVFANHSSGLQFMNLLKLFASSENFLNANLKYYEKIMELLHVQLAKMPAEYLHGGLLDYEQFGKVMNQFGEIVRDASSERLKKLFRELQETDLAKFGVVVNIDDDEDDEEGPVMV